MPFYDLICACGNEFNIKATVRERAEMALRCPVCGGSDLRADFKALNYVKSRKGSEGECPKAQSCGRSCPMRSAGGR